MQNAVRIYREWLDIIKSLPEDSQYPALRAIIDYGLDGKEPEDEDPNVRMVFLGAKPLLDTNKRKDAASQRRGKKDTARKE